MRDRLAELRQNANISNPFEESGDLEEGNYFMEGAQDTKKFFDQVTEIRQLFVVIRKATTEMDQAYASTLGATRDSLIEEGKAIVDKKMNEIHRTANTIQNKLKAMKKEFEDLMAQEVRDGRGGMSADLRTRQTQHAALSHEFVEVMSVYHEVQSQNKSKFEQRLERQYRIVNPNATDEEIEKVLDAEQGPIFAKQILEGTKKAEHQKVLKDIQDRHQDLLKLEESLKELHRLFVEMRLIVEEQGEMLNEIETTLGKAVNFTEAGAQEMKRAARYQRQARKKIFFIGICCAIILLIIYNSFLQLRKNNNNCIPRKHSSSSTLLLNCTCTTRGFGKVKPINNWFGTIIT